MLKQRKGITPVIAIVLLLLVTVGAVGVVYTQFQNIAGNVGDQTGQSDARDTYVTINSVVQSDKGTMNLTVTNNRNSVPINSTEMLELAFYPDGTDPSAAVPFRQDSTVNNINFTDESSTCFQPGHETAGDDGVILETGESFTCDTHVEWPESSEYVGIQVQVQGSSKAWNKRCEPLTTNSESC